MRKLTFVWKPPKCEVIVYSRESFPYLKTLLEGVSYEVMDIDFKRNFSGQLCLNALLRAATDRNMRNVPLFGRYSAHYAQLAECHLVIAAVQVRSSLAHVALLRSNVRRITFQVSSWTGQFTPDEHSMTTPADVLVVWLDNFQREVSSLTYAVRPPLDSSPEIISLGSLKSNQVPIASKRLAADAILFISQWRPHFDESFYEQELQLLPLLEHWCTEKGLTLEVLGCSLEDPSTEKLFFKKLLQTDNFKFLARSDRWQSSFEILDQAILVVTVHSSLGLEALSRGRKALFFTHAAAPYPRLLFRGMGKKPIGPCWVSDGNLDSFWKLLNTTSQLGEDEFFRTLGEDSGIVPRRDEGLRKTRALVRAEMDRGESP